MPTDKRRKDFEKPIVDEELIMNIMSGNQSSAMPEITHQQEIQKVIKPKEKSRNSSRKVDFEETFLVNRFPSGRNGKVVYIRPDYHERLLRIVQLTREEKTTLYSYIDNILEHHFSEFGDDITNYFNERFKPIL